MQSTKNLTKYRHQIGVGGIEITDREKQLVNEVLNSNQLTYGKYSKQFEHDFSKLHQSNFGLYVNSGTSALQIALHALKIEYNWKDGDEVIVPSVTFVATSNIVMHLNMVPVFVDVCDKTYNIDPRKIEEKISPRTRAIIPVHLLGLPAEMGPIMEIAKKHQLKVVEDSCECMFATYKNKSVGSFGDIGCFSTYVAHILVTGVGGFAITSDTNLATIMRSLMNHGRDNIYISTKDDHNVDQGKFYEIIDRRFSFCHVGYSYRCTELEAAIGLGQLERYESLMLRRKQIAKRLTEGLSSLQDHIQLPSCPSDRTHAYMLYGIVLKNEPKQKLVRFLEDLNIETRDMLPLLNQPIYKKIFGNLEDDYPVAKWINNNGFYIGSHPYVTDQEIDFVIEAFQAYFKQKNH